MPAAFRRNIIIAGGLLVFICFLGVMGVRPTPAQVPDHLADLNLSPLRKGEFLLMSRQASQALQVFKDIWQAEPDNSHAVRGIVRSYMALEELPKARTFFLEYLKALPKSSSAVYGLGYIDYLESQFDASRKQLEEAVRLDSRNALALNALAAALTELHDLEGALRRVKAAIELLPEELMFYRNLKMIYVRSGQADKFSGEYQASLESGDTARARNYGMILAQEKRQASFKLYADGKIDETVSAIMEMLKIYQDIDHKPGIVSGLFSLAVLYEEQGKADLALKAYQEVLKINPQHIQAREKMHNLSPEHK